MEIGDAVLKKDDHLNYLATNSQITDDIYKKIVNRCFELFFESSPKIPNDISLLKEETVTGIYSSLISYIVDIISNKEDEESVKRQLSQLGFNNQKVNYFLSELQEKRSSIEACFDNQHPSKPSIVDCSWRFDQNITAFAPPRKPKPKYYILIKAADGTESKNVRFSCNMSQMQDLHSKIREIVNHIEKVSSS